MGIIDNKYDVAISSAFSERLKQIVVDDVATAEKCIQILKSQNAGRATFIIMERAGTLHAGNVQTPENAPRLVDLVQPKKAEFRKAFYTVLNDTIVADNMDQANRLAFGKTRWKVVTLDGNVIDRSGTMSGGGNRVSRGAMEGKFTDNSQVMSPEDISRTQGEQKIADKEIANSVSHIARLEAELQQLVKHIAETSNSLAKYETDLSSLSQQVGNLEAQISSFVYVIDIHCH